MLDTEQEPSQLDAAKLQALRAAVEQGWADVAAGRYTDVADDDLDDFIGQLGARAAAGTPSSRQ